MDESKKAPALSKTPSSGKKRQGPPISIWERIPFGAYLAIGVVVVLALGIGLPVYFGNRHMSSMDMSSSADSKSSNAAAATLGGPAPAFTLKDPSGQSFSVSPGDGKAHVLVFYMGYF